jgi:hypothetical protein
VRAGCSSTSEQTVLFAFSKKSDALPEIVSNAALAFSAGPDEKPDDCDSGVTSFLPDVEMEWECLMAPVRAPLEENFDLFASFPLLCRRPFAFRCQLQSAGRLYPPRLVIPR